MGEVAVVVAVGSDPLVDLEHGRLAASRRRGRPSSSNIRHGPWPPLTASEKRPRSATDVRGRLGDQLGAATRGGLGVGDDLAFKPVGPPPPTQASPLTALLGVAAELLAHRGEHLVGEVVEVAGREARVERAREHRRRHALLDRRDRGPATLAGVRDPALEVVERRATGAAPRRSGRAATSRSRCRAARPRRPRGCRARTGSTRDRSSGAVSASASRSCSPASAFSRMLRPSA